MKSIKFIAIILAVIVGSLGLIFITAAFSDKSRMTARLITGAICLVIAGVLIVLARIKVEQVTHTYHQEIDLSGDIDLETLKCNSCGGTLSKENVTVKAGAVFVDCPYCRSSYQLKEAPKW